MKSFFYPQLLKKRETPLSLKLVQTSLAQTKIHRGRASPYPPPSPPLQAVMLHPPESAPQTPVGSLKTFLGRRRAVPSLPKSPYKGCSVARGPTLGPAPHQHEDLPCGAGIFENRSMEGVKSRDSPPKKNKSSIRCGLPLLPEGPGGLHHLVGRDAGDVDGDGDDGPGEPVLLQRAPDHVPVRIKATWGGENRTPRRAQTTGRLRNLDKLDKTHQKSGSKLGGTPGPPFLVGMGFSRPFP